MTKITVFIGSSSEQLKTAHALKACLDPFVQATVWDDAAFKLNESVFGALSQAADQFDFAVFVFDADDVAMIRRTKVHVVRDNVLFEFGLFTGRIGRERAFWISTQGTEKSHIPADLAGIIHLSFERPKKNDPDKLRAALGPPCARLRSQIENLGPRTDRTIEELSTVRILCAASSQYSEPKFAEDIAAIQGNFPPGSIESAHGVNAKELWRYFMSGETWDIVHLAMYVDPLSGDLLIPSRGALPRANAEDRIQIGAVENLIKDSGARLVVVVTCDSLVLAARIARTVNTIAGHKPIDVGSALNWSSVFYHYLARGCPLSEAFNRALTFTDPGLLLLVKRDFRLHITSAGKQHQRAKRKRKRPKE